jgi:hypothetical protein
MEYLEHNIVSQDVQMQLVNSYKAAKGTEWLFWITEEQILFTVYMLICNDSY